MYCHHTIYDSILVPKIQDKNSGNRPSTGFPALGDAGPDPTCPQAQRKSHSRPTNSTWACTIVEPHAHLAGYLLLQRPGPSLFLFSLSSLALFLSSSFSSLTR